MEVTGDRVKVHYLLLGGLLLLVPQAASAYLDPGVGSMIWQMLVAVALGAVFTLKVYWSRIKDYVRGRREI
ncbi:hypothetical protein [Methanofollis ethanolicus]|uniref:hypothetical protein n=1 Tax=Methanofollis ethanolicus TaxID=488124 RepID=UPI00082EA870|nr:hypothetical protein [Methanofollis ethanolicus]